MSDARSRDLPLGSAPWPHPVSVASRDCHIAYKDNYGENSDSHSVFVAGTARTKRRMKINFMKGEDVASQRLRTGTFSSTSSPSV